LTMDLFISSAENHLVFRMGAGVVVKYKDCIELIKRKRFHTANRQKCIKTFTKKGSSVILAVNCEQSIMRVINILIS